MSSPNHLADLRRDLDRHRQEVQGLSYDADFTRFPQIRDALQRPRRHALLKGVGSVTGVAMLSGILLPWYITLFLVPAAVAVSWLYFHRALDKTERQIFAEQRQNMLDQVPAQLNLTPAIGEAIGRLPEWIFTPPRLPPPGTMAEAGPSWRGRVQELVQSSVAAMESIAAVHRRGLLSDWVQGEGEVLDRAEQALVPLLDRAASLADLYQAVGTGSPGARATADDLLKQLELVSHTLQDAAALAVRCATSPHEGELERLHRQMEQLEQATRIWQEANQEV